MIKRITQSFIKDYREYKAGNECGLIIHHKYVLEKLLPGSKATKEGSYFEYLLSGAFPKDGETPKPVMAKSGNEMLQGSRRVVFNAKYVGELLIMTYGLQILERGVKKRRGLHEGTLDLIVVATRDVSFPDSDIIWKKGDRFIIDLKYSGLIDEKWNKLGWAWTDEQKRYHGTQAIHYGYVGDFPFYFLVCDSTNAEKKDEYDSLIKGQFDNPNVKLFYVPVLKEAQKAHLREAEELFKDFKFHESVGFTPKPSMSRCCKCSLAEDCKSKQTYPYPEIVDLTPFE